MAVKEVKKDEVLNKKDNNKVTKTKKEVKNNDVTSMIEQNFLFFLISVLCFIAGMVMYVIYGLDKKTKNRSIVCLYGSLLGVLVVFLIGLLWGVNQIG